MQMNVFISLLHWSKKCQVAIFFYITREPSIINYVTPLMEQGAHLTKYSRKRWRIESLTHLETDSLFAHCVVQAPSSVRRVTSVRPCR